MSEFYIRAGEDIQGTAELKGDVSLTTFLESISQLQWIVIDGYKAIQVSQIKSIEKLL